MQQFLNTIYNALGAVLAFFYSLIPNLGVAIILLTLVVMVVLYPLTAKQAKSMMAMQRVQPEIKKLQAKYKGDRQKLNEEMMKFYQENKINPLAGCLPLVVQLPIFFALFRVLRDPFKHIPKTGSFSSLYTAFCGGVSKCTSSSVHHLKFLTLDLQKTPTEAHGLNAVLAFLLVGLVVVTGMLQTKQAQSRTPAASKQMGTVMKILPVFFGLISLQFPAGLVLYFFVSNLFRVGQQELIFRRHGTAASPARGGPKPPRGGGAAIDVASSDRTEPESGTPDGDGEVEQAEAPPPASKPKRVNRSPARPATPERATVPEQRVRGGGLRSLFQLPPPPAGNGGGRTKAPSRPPSAGTPRRPGPSVSAGSGSGGRPPPQRRRRSSKKKRKR
jgi:YidC/Oxa1 family membrane protein insertase